ncbi:MAG: DUF1573 domain-containing protein [Puniceicoccales bacterium]|jgi:hypothetical protein|nr:DUF1573 domain-containing protein [Puniceicoccales bacterium]
MLLKNKFFIISSILVILLVGAVVGYDQFDRNEFYCEETTVFLGRLPVENGIAQGKHRFKLVNKTNHEVLIKRIVIGCACVRVKMDEEKILPGNTSYLNVEMRLLPEHIMPYQVSIIIVAENQERSIPINLTVSGCAEFTPFFSKKSILFDNCHYSDFKEDEFILSFPSKEKFSKALSHLNVDHPDTMKVSIKAEALRELEDVDGGKFFCMKQKSGWSLLPKNH